LDPLARSPRFHLLERERIFRLMEGGLTDVRVFDISEASMGPPIATRQAGKSKLNPLNLIRDKKSDSTFKRFGKASARMLIEPALIVKDMVMGGDADSLVGGALGWNEKTSWLDRAQDVVDVIGVIDPTGVADAANALGYAARGKWGDAAVSALGVIPYVGDAGKIVKWGARASKAGKTAKKSSMLAKAAKFVEKGAAKMAEKRAAKAAGKVAVHGAEKAAAKTAAKPAGKFARAKEFYGKGKEIYGRGKEAHDRIQARKAAREGGAPEQPPERSPIATPTPEEPVAPRPDTTADLGRRGTGPLSGEAPAPSLAPPDPGPLAKAREAERPLSGPAAKGTPGGASRGDQGSTQVPVDADCPEGKPTSSKWGAKEGHKRCNKGTPGTHGD